MKQAYVYILASQMETLYIGVTSNLKKRVFEHKSGFVDGFSKKYQCHNLVYFEEHSTMYAAITREKQMKKWKREWKMNAIHHFNPLWKDLYEEMEIE